MPAAPPRVELILPPGAAPGASRLSGERSPAELRKAMLDANGADTLGTCSILPAAQPSLVLWSGACGGASAECQRRSRNNGEIDGALSRSRTCTERDLNPPP